MNKKLLACAFLTLSFSLVAQQGDGGIPKSVKAIQSLSLLDKKIFFQPDIASLKAEDALTDKTGNAPWRFGYNNPTSLNMTNSGSWTTLPNGDRIWRLAIICQNALTVNLTLDQVSIPEGNELYVYNQDKSFILGKFKAYHVYEGTLGTELIPGNTAILEYYIPSRNIDQTASLNVNTVTHGYRTAGEFQEKAFGSSGNCNMNVNCSDGSSWVDQRNSTVMLVSEGNGFCTGALINNTMNNGRPFVLTANHCYGNGVTSWIFRFNWQASACADPGSSPTFTSLSGAVLRARRTPSDMCLVEITGGLVGGTVPASFNPYFSGWDNTGVIPSSTVCIHHPDGDIKKISFDDNPPIITQQMNSNESNATWSVQWDRNTTTEPGSSGSPLFDQNHRIIGQLWGGTASCSNLNAPDHYGRLANSWNPPGSSSSNHLKTWLNPGNTGATVVDGYNPAGPTNSLDAAMTANQGVSGSICSGTGTVNPKVTILNSGTNVLTSATIHYGFDGSTGSTYNWTGSLSQYQTQVIVLPTATLSAGIHSFKAIVSNPNAGSDQNHLNDTTSSTFTVQTNGFPVDFNLTTDCFSEETSWVLKNAAGTTTLYQGGPYDGPVQTINTEFCLSEGCYKFTISDQWSDGMSSTSCANGFYTIKQNGTTLAELTAANANFGASRTDDFCVASTVGLKEKESASSWKLYPNPTSDFLTIEVTSEGTKTIEITNATGQIIQTIQSDMSAIKVPAETLAKGMYFIRLTSNDGTSQKSFIVK